MLLYMLTTLMVTMTPGPGKILTIENAIKYNMKTVLLGVFGMSFAVLIISILSAFGINLIFKEYPNFFIALQLLGIMYIYILSYKQLNSNFNLAGMSSDVVDVKSWDMIKKGFFITITNPKQLVFFSSLFPQFINLSLPYEQQIISLIIVFLIFFVLTHFVYAYFSKYIKNQFQHHDNFEKYINAVLAFAYLLFGTVMLVNLIIN